MPVDGLLRFTEAPVGVEPTMADLQSAALATWLRRQLDSRLETAVQPLSAGYALQITKSA